jgi:DNA-binding CsgD family transcriptional regulator
MYYKGYHSTSEGKHIFDAIKLHINKYRLTTNVNLLNNKVRLSKTEIESLLTTLYLSESPYEIKQGIRYIRNTNKLVSEHTKIMVIDIHNNINTFKSMSECAENLNISRSTIKQYLNTGKSYKGYIFVLVEK